ncbi:MAG: DUF1761 domain-containing protein [Pseudomonadota bacterium]
MDIASAFSTINWLAVVGAALSSFFVGGLWYGPLFGRAWMTEFGFSEADLEKRNLPLVFGGSLLLALIASINLALFLGPEADLAFGISAGFFAGFGWVGMFLGILYLFEFRSLKAFLINAGYCTVALTIMGAILGAF